MSSSVANPSAYPKPIGPWLNKVRCTPVRLITADELKQWILFEDERLFVINKPGDLVCHPSKDGPWSSLVGAAREYLGLPAVHLIFRLDRETSGIVIFGKDAATGRKMQMAAERRRYEKEYLAIHWGELPGVLEIDQPLGPDYESVVNVKRRVVAPGDPGAQTARTRFTPVHVAHGYTLTRVKTETGRQHQIRAHAQWAGFPLVGDKIYGPDARLYLDFVEEGWNEKLAERLLLPRQALHCSKVDLTPMDEPYVFESALPEDLLKFCRDRMDWTGSAGPSPA
jgi:23S rRNA pseudouridine1911/1915/1917 synthase